MTRREHVIKIINGYAANIANCTQPAAMQNAADKIEQLYVSDIPSPLYECVFDGLQFVLLSEYEKHYMKEHNKS